MVRGGASGFEQLHPAPRVACGFGQHGEKLLRGNVMRAGAGDQESAGLE